MSSKSLSLLFLTLTILVSFISAANIGHTYITGAYEPIGDPKDPKIVEIGKFAVAEHDKKAKAALGFFSVVRGEVQVVAGLNYKLVIAAKDGVSTLIKNYEAVVYYGLYDAYRELVSFQEIKG